MAETIGIGRMAEILADEVFLEFGWEKEGPTNGNWTCETPDHNLRTHPSDVVFSYKEPYRSFRTYVNCDLKSYGDETIQPERLREAMKSLSMAVDCAQRNSEWQSRYLRGDESADVVGLLFVYNHDNEYDRNFAGLYDLATAERIQLTRRNKMFVLSPSEVCELNTIVNDIIVSRGKKELPDRPLCSFFYPDQSSRILRKEWRLPATLEMLKSSMVTLKHKSNEEVTDHDGITIYYKGSGRVVEEFIYLIDYLIHWQLVSTDISINIRLTRPAEAAVAVFERAKKDYASRYNHNDQISARLENIRVSSVRTVVERFSEIEIGMESRDGV